MADRFGRCGNIEYCREAVSQRVILLAERADFECPRCGHALNSAGAARPWRRSRTLLTLAVAAILFGGAALTWTLTSPGAIETPSSAASTAQTAPPDTRKHEPAATAVLLRLTSADAAGALLATHLAASYLGATGHTGVTVRPGDAEGVTDVLGLLDGTCNVVTITLNPAHPGPDLRHQRTGDVVISTNRPAVTGAERPSSQQNLTLPTTETAIGLQGIVAAVNPANPAATLSLMQLSAIISGRIADWSALGGPPSPIHVYVARDLAGNAIPQGAGTDRNAIAATATWVTADAMARALAADRGGIGLLSLGSGTPGKVLALGELGAVAIAPNKLAITTEIYPLVRRIYLDAMPDAANPASQRFLEWTLSPAGQQAIETAGFIPSAIRTHAAPSPAATPDRVRRATAGITRTSLNLHISTGGDRPDRSAAWDVNGLFNQIRDRGINPIRLLPAALTGDIGTPKSVQADAMLEIKAVHAALKQLTQPFGASDLQRLSAMVLGALKP